MSRFSFRRTAANPTASGAASERPAVRVRARLVTTSAGTIWVRPAASSARVAKSI
jgi:hypothetical protein